MWVPFTFFTTVLLKQCAHIHDTLYRWNKSKYHPEAFRVHTLYGIWLGYLYGLLTRIISTTENHWLWALLLVIITLAFYDNVATLTRRMWLEEEVF